MHQMRGAWAAQSGQVAESLFPVRFLGFGFYWAWLFLAGVTPSPLIGAPLCFAGAPFEMVELSVRALVLVVVLIASRQLASVAGQRGLLVLGVAASAAAAPLALGLGGAEAASASAVAAAIGEVCMFLLWLCFFGYMKVGETFVLLVGSYAIGSVLFLLTAALGFNAMAAASVLFPALSGTAFVLSQRLMKARTGEELFVEEPVSGDGARETGGGRAAGRCRCGLSPWGSGRRGESRAPESAHRRGPCPVLVLLLPLVRHRPVQWGGSDRGLHGGAGGHDCAGGYLRGLLQVRPSARSTLQALSGRCPAYRGWVLADGRLAPSRRGGRFLRCLGLRALRAAGPQRLLQYREGQRRVAPARDGGGPAGHYAGNVLGLAGGVCRGLLGGCGGKRVELGGPRAVRGSGFRLAGVHRA